ncbi:hypothetical protein ORI20_04005 [Mycobacterium sp. CVI_P3]|uniref:Intersectin-EH binding protein Ibp1 n=1 Tax=Mycobacterium pinniadriaticum TaxID=2994102 RepID=A0ABT3S906_9MYCO|nr:hypothetical protein [Mycobacterium pinniadriaticum]MCX2929423.1 hypothetical protein [Mycobacterium pinniadriaticum]MCX2935847.1 hypothetical protein [Mycobacterium pinniadriaticum]
MKQRILIAAGVVSLALGSVAFAAPASADCPAGTVPTRFPGVCTAGQSGGQLPQAIGPSDVTTNFQPNQIPSMNGVPCNWNHAVTCWGMAQNAG